MNRKPNRTLQRHQTGLTLVELLITLSVAAVTLGTALPGFEAARERRHLDGAAAQLKTDIHFVRSLAVAQNRSLRISFERDGTGSCYVAHSGSVGDCVCSINGEATCRGDAQAMRSVRFASGDALRLQSNIRSMVFDPTKGTNTPTATLQLIGRDDKAVHLVVNIMGRVRSCTPTPGLAGYPAC
jgi:type IV fimbrial biogenesis protein FimT